MTNGFYLRLDETWGFRSALGKRIAEAAQSWKEVPLAKAA